MPKFKMVKSFFLYRIYLFGSLGIFCYIVFALNQITIITDLPNLWEVLITGLGGIFLALGSYYLSRYRTFGKIDDFLMGHIDDACNELINANDPNKLEPSRDVHTPKLLVEQVYDFGMNILQTFCKKEIFQLVEGGIFAIKDQILPIHPTAIYPKSIKIDPSLYDLIANYIDKYPEEMAVFITNRSKKIIKIVNVDNKRIEELSGKINDLLQDGVSLPFQKAIITPITFDSINIGYLLLFYHSQTFWAKFFNPKEMIDNYMLKKIEDWKLDDVIKSIINKERLLLTFYLVKCIDDITTPILRLDYKSEKIYNEHFPRVCKEILETICNLLKIENGGFVLDYRNNNLISYNLRVDDQYLYHTIIPYINNKISATKRKVSYFPIKEISSNKMDFDFKNIIYINIENEGDNLGLISLFATRDFEEFDSMIFDIIEDLKLDDLFLLFQKSQ